MIYTYIVFSLWRGTFLIGTLLEHSFPINFNSKYFNFIPNNAISFQLVIVHSKKILVRSCLFKVFFFQMMISRFVVIFFIVRFVIVFKMFFLFVLVFFTYVVILSILIVCWILLFFLFLTFLIFYFAQFFFFFDFVFHLFFSIFELVWLFFLLWNLFRYDIYGYKMIYMESWWSGLWPHHTWKVTESTTFSR